MKPAATARGGRTAARLTRDDWRDAAFAAVVDGGFDNVRVLAIADTLGVTRGSFYWHFADHADLVAALLARWREGELQSTRALAADPADDPQADLERLLESALAHAGSDLSNMRFELAVRGLGRRDPEVARQLVELDRARLQLFRNKFERLTQDPEGAAELASLFYLAIVGGYQALSRPATPLRMKAHLQGVIAKYLIHRQATARPSRSRGAAAAR